VIRYGIFGFGLQAVRRLMPGFALASSSRVTALLRRDMKQAQASAAEYKIPHAFDLPPRFAALRRSTPFSWRRPTART
jgi:predicted dehydrogenase